MLCPQIMIWICVHRLIKRILKKINTINLFKNFLWYSGPVYSHVSLPVFIISHVQYQLSSQRHRPVLHFSIDTLLHGVQTFGRKGRSSPFGCPNHWCFIVNICAPPFLPHLQIISVIFKAFEKIPFSGSSLTFPQQKFLLEIFITLMSVPHMWAFNVNLFYHYLILPFVSTLSPWKQSR